MRCAVPVENAGERELVGVDRNAVEAENRDAMRNGVDDSPQLML